MKSCFNSLVTIVMVIVLSSCGIDNFGDLNTDPNAVSDADPEHLFTSAQLDAVSENYSGGAYRTISQAMQKFATYKEVPAAGDKYFNDDPSKSSWNLYQGALNTLRQAQDELSDEAEDINKVSILRIWRVFIYSRLTDLYGDIPYSDAEKALSDGIFAPKYDEQSFIYDDMFNELQEAIDAFDTSQSTFGSGDLIYDGDIDQWTKFAYSMMLRLGMRLSKVDEQTAQQWVQQAIEGGIILNDEDIALIEYVDGSQVATRNFIATAMNNGDFLDPQDVDNIEGSKFAKTFIDHLKSTSDPRLNVWAVVWVESESGQYVADTTSSLQRGMENAAYNKIPDDFETFSEPHPNTILSYSSPYLVTTNAENYLLLAEAAIRGWYSGDAETLYENAVKAGMRQWAMFGSDGEISDAQIDAYLSANPFKEVGSFEEKLEQIITQKWVTLTIENPYEVFANWRRTGYPELEPTNYPGNLTGGQIPRRFVVPESEGLYNAENFEEASQRQGGNTFMTRVWWDQEN